jgi:hypothetical protein
MESLTGKQFDELFDRRTDSSYTDYYDPATKAAFYRQAMILAVEQKYRTNDNQTSDDDIRNLVVLSKEVPLRQSKAILQPLTIQSLDEITGQVIFVEEHLAEVNDTIELTIQGFAPSLTGTYTIAAIIDSKTIQVAFPVTSGTLVRGRGVTINTIKDYFHYLSSDVEYKQKVKIKIDSATDLTPLTFVASDISDIRTGERLFITVSQTTNNINGFRYVKKVGKQKFECFVDKNLDTPVMGNIPYQVGDSKVERVLKNTSYPVPPDLSGQRIDEPVYIQPRHTFGNGRLEYQPSGAIKAYIDYVKKPPLDIDPTDDIVDLTTYYPYRFLIYLIEQAALLFFRETKDIQGTQLAQQQITENP